jgi:hypothetical protein
MALGLFVICNSDGRSRPVDRSNILGWNNDIADAFIEGYALGIQLLEAITVSCKRAPAIPGPLPGSAGRDLEVYNQVCGKLSSHARITDRTAAQRNNTAAASQKALYGLCLAPSKGLLSVAVKEGLDGLTELALELSITVERLGSKRARKPACGG